MKINSGKGFALLLSGAVGAAWTVFLFIEELQMRAPGLRRLALVGCVFLAIMVLGYWLLSHQGPVFSRFHRWQQKAMLISACVFAGLLLVMIPIPTDKFFYALLPSQNLTITSENGLLEKVEILQFNSGTGAVNPAELSKAVPGKITWQGKVGDQAVLTFKAPEQNIRVRVAWGGGLSQSIELSAIAKNPIYVKQDFSISWVERILWLICVWLALGSVILTGMFFLVSAPWKAVEKQNHWLWYSIPMIAVWTIYLLTFWPGLMSPDSITQWGEVQSGQFSDAHPAIHSMLIWLLSRLVDTPAVLVLFHILLLSLLTAWGLGELQKRRVSPSILWAGAFLFALYPINDWMVISVWKDITYACALFAFFLQFVKISFSEGKWLQNNWNLAGLLLAGLTVAFVRHNGLPVILGSLVVLVWVYRKTFRRVLSAAAIFLFLWVVIQGPLYAALKVKLYPGFGNILFLDHINAHIHAGTPLQPEEKAFIESLLPLADWPYDCSNSDIRKTDGPIPFDYFTIATTQPARVAINLFLRDPRVDIEHTLCASSLAWEINTGHYLSVVSLSQNKAGVYTWVTENNLGLAEKSFFPNLIPILVSGLFSDKSLFSKPAFYLLVSILLMAVVFLRQSRAKLPLYIVPLVFQTGVMLLVNFAQDFRYHYATVLIALFCLAMAFTPKGMDE